MSTLEHRAQCKDAVQQAEAAVLPVTQADMTARQGHSGLLTQWVTTLFAVLIAHSLANSQPSQCPASLRALLSS